MSAVFERRDAVPAGLDGWGDRLLFQTSPWLAFVAETQGAEPVFAELKDGGKTVGWFTGLTFRRYGVKLLGSPFPGWTTAYMGFNLVDGYPRRAALAGLRDFAFRELGCLHLELCDRTLTPEDARAEGYDFAPGGGYELDLRPDEAAIFANMEKDCRNFIRKGEKSGVVIEEAAGDESFVADYCAQLADVFAKQSLVPTYTAARVRALIKHLGPTGDLLLLRARGPEGDCVATGLFPAFKTHMYFWGGASWRKHQHLRPNELLIWTAMRHWKARGALTFDMMGRRDYKKKFGPYEIAVPWLRASRYGALERLRNAAKTLVGLKQKAMGWRKG